jgi:Sensors of blue-light using FAD
MTIFQLIYSSQPMGFDDAMLNGILAISRRNNAARGITGCLVCRYDLYLQMLEGDEAEVEQLYRRINADDRHVDVRRLIGERVDARLFPDWAMRDDPARSWMWSPDQVHAGALIRASPQHLRAVFERIALETA